MTDHPPHPGDIILSGCDHSGRWSEPYIRMGYRVIRLDPKHGVGVDQGGRGLTMSGLDAPVFHGPTTTIMSDEGEGWPVTIGMASKLLHADPYILGAPVRGLLMAPPCTDFTVSGARWWPQKDADGRTAASVAVIYECLSLVQALKKAKEMAPSEEAWRWLVFWVLENPVGRLKRLVPELPPALMTFHPNEYAGLADTPRNERYTKRTCLHGEFNTDLPKSEQEAVMIERVNKAGRVLRGSWMWANLGGKSERTKELRSVTPQGFSRAFAIANP